MGGLNDPAPSDPRDEFTETVDDGQFEVLEVGGSRQLPELV